MGKKRFLKLMLVTVMLFALTIGLVIPVSANLPLPYFNDYQTAVNMENASPSAAISNNRQGALTGVVSGNASGNAVYFPATGANSSGARINVAPDTGFSGIAVTMRMQTNGVFANGANNSQYRLVHAIVNQNEGPFNDGASYATPIGIFAQNNSQGNTGTGSDKVNLLSLDRWPQTNGQKQIFHDSSEWHEYTFVLDATIQNPNVFTDAASTVSAFDGTTGKAYVYVDGKKEAENLSLTPAKISRVVKNNGGLSFEFGSQPNGGSLANMASWFDYIKVYKKPAAGSVNASSISGATVSPMGLSFELDFTCDVVYNDPGAVKVYKTGFPSEPLDIVSKQYVPSAAGSKLILGMDTLEPSESYTIDLSEMNDVFARPLSGAASFTFSTNSEMPPVAVVDVPVKNEVTVGKSVNVTGTYRVAPGKTLNSNEPIKIYDGNTKISVASDITVTPNIGDPTGGVFRYTLNVTELKDYVIKANITDSSGFNTNSKTVTFTRIPMVYPVNMSFAEFKVDGDEFNTASKVTKPGNAKVRVDVKNNSDESLTPRIIAAAYTGNKLYSIGVSDGLTAIASGVAKSVTVNLEIPDNIQIETVKLMAFNGLNTLEPLGAILTKDIKTASPLKLSRLYSDGMILQRDSSDLKICGEAATGTVVTVTFGGKNYSTTAVNNRFAVPMESLPASLTGRTLTVTDGATTFNFTDVLVGDVFYGSGQSNMWLQMGTVYDSQNGITASTIPANVRYYVVARTPQAKDRIDPIGAADAQGRPRPADYDVGYNWSGEPDHDWYSPITDWQEVWRPLNMNTKGMVSQIMYWMSDFHRKNGGMELDENVPIGFIYAGHGGTYLGNWVGEEIYLNNSTYRNLYNSESADKTLRKYRGSNGKGVGIGIGDFWYNMTKQVMSYTMKAAVWYQGEEDLQTVGYDSLLPAMISQYRAETGYDIPYFVIQLPGNSNAGNGWEAQRLRQDAGVKVVTNGNAYLVSAPDTGDKKLSGDPADTIHPHDKDILGARLGSIMLNKLFGKNIPYAGPVYNSMSISGNKIILTFDNVNDGIHGSLCSQNGNGSLPGFEIAGADGVFVSATAAIVSGTVEVSTTSVANPKDVRYGYIKAPLKSLGNTTFYNGSNVILPAAPFRTDGKF